MEDNISQKRTKIEEKMDLYFDDQTTSSSYIAEQSKEKVQLRKKKIFNKLFAKKKENYNDNNINNINSPRYLDINNLKCDEEIKKDVDEYVKTNFNIKNWFKYLFSNNKNDNYVSLILINRYVIYQLTEKDESKRILSRNDTELIQKLCDNLLNDDIKIIYISCQILTNLCLFPKNIENRIYSERNLEKILQFFNNLSANISLLGYETLYLFFNISANIDVKINLIKNSFLDNFFNFIGNIVNKTNNNINDILEFNIIKNCISILSQLFLVCDIDDNYINKFLPFLPVFKIIVSKYFGNYNNLEFDDNEINNIILIMNYYSRNQNQKEKIVAEIIKDNFIQVLFQLYYKIKDIKIKIKMLESFTNFLDLGNEFDKILINDGIIKFYTNEIANCQYSSVALINIIVFSCYNLATGNIGQQKILFESGIIFKIIDIVVFYIDDNLDKELKALLINSLTFLTNIINGDDQEIKKNILIYKNYSIINILCKVLKMDLIENILVFKSDDNTIYINPRELTENIIYAFNNLNIVIENYEETQPNLRIEYTEILLKNSFEELINKYYEKKCLTDNIKEIIDEIKSFVKDLSKEN